MFSSTTALQRFVHRLTSRSVLTQEEQSAILDLPGTAEQVGPNRDFVPLGSRIDHSCLVVAGLVGRFGQNSEGGRQITALHIRGDMADLHSVVQQVPTSALQALTVSTLLRVPHQALRRLSARYPAVAEAFWRDCMVDTAILAQWVVNVGRRSARQRIAHLICEMATRYHGAQVGNDITFDLPITQHQLADASGLTPVHVNRTLQKLPESNIVSWSRGHVVHVAGWAELKRIADFEAEYLQAQVEPAGRLRMVEIK